MKLSSLFSKSCSLKEEQKEEKQEQDNTSFTNKCRQWWTQTIHYHQNLQSKSMNFRQENKTKNKNSSLRQSIINEYYVPD